MSELDDYLDTYLAEHHDRYTREALTRELVEAGHDPAAIEAAWARLQTSAEPPTPAPTQPEEPGRGATILMALATIVIVMAYGGAILAAGVTILYGGAVSVLMIAYVAAMLAALVYSLRRLARANSPRAGMSGVAIAFAISAAVFIGLSGTCFALLGPAFNASGGFL
jgi:hypothetical protein